MGYYVLILFWLFIKPFIQQKLALADGWNVDQNLFCILEYKKKLGT